MSEPERTVRKEEIIDVFPLRKDKGIAGLTVLGSILGILVAITIVITIKSITNENKEKIIPALIILLVGFASFLVGTTVLIAPTLIQLVKIRMKRESENYREKESKMYKNTIKVVLILTNSTIIIGYILYLTGIR